MTQAKRKKRVVMGVGYAWATEKYEIRLLPKKDVNCTMKDNCKNLRGLKMLEDKKIRLIAEIL